MENKRITLKPHGSLLGIQNDAVPGNRSVIKKTLVNIREDLSEIKRTNPLVISKGGIPLLYDESENTVYVDATDSHSLIIGSTGSKKTRLVVLPLVHMLCYAEESMIISDPKAEIYNRTAAMLKNNGYKVTVLNFRNPSFGEGWNPLAIPYELYKVGERDRAYEFINDIATNLMCSELSHQDVFWEYSASDLLFGLILLAFKRSNGNSVSFEDVLGLRAKLFNNGNPDLNIWEDAKSDLLIHHSLIGTVEAPDRTRTSILSTFDQKMRIFSFQENLTDMLRQNTISVDRLGFEKSVVFLIMPDEKTTYHRLISLFVKQCYERLIYLAQNLKQVTFKTRINYILDEFSTLPTINDFPAMITAARSRNIRFFLFVQSQKQLEHRYKVEAETIESNCNNWIFLTSREISLLQSISLLAGQTADGKPLISVFALQHLDKEKGEALVFSGRLFPFITELVDIGKIDNDEYEVLEMTERIPVRTTIDKIDNGSTDSLEDDKLAIEPVKDDTYDLQKELERKFDELFGPINDESENEVIVDKEKDKLIETSKVVSLDCETKMLHNKHEEGTDEEDLDNIIVLKDDKGNDCKFEFLDLIEYQNEEYVVLLPIVESQGEDAGEVVILRVEEDDLNGDEESYCSVEDEDVLMTIFKIFKDKFKDEFDFET